MIVDNKKQKISEINKDIGDFVNDSTIKKTNIFSKKQDGYWDQFFVAIDTIKDTCIAIENFQKDLGDCFIKNPYLATYGILQALFIQQDAVNHLKISLFGENKNIKWKKAYPKLDEIRQLRNETIGHPVQTKQNGRESKYNKDEITACSISRSSLSKEGFDYILWMNSKTNHKYIKFKEIIDIQNENLGAELLIIFEELKEEEKRHKLKFKDEKLFDYLNNKSLYEIHLIYGVSWNDLLAWPSFDYFLKQYKKIREGLEKRYGKFGALTRISGTELVVKKLDYIFLKMENFKNMGKFDKQEFEIYVDALKASLNELKIHLKEIDEEFKI